MPPEQSGERPTTRLASAERREAILDAAELVFVRSGFQATGTRDLAQACGVTEPVLYRHFHGKNELFLAVITRMIDDGIAELANAVDDARREQAIRRALEAILLVDAASSVSEATELARSRLAAMASAIADATGHDGIKIVGQRLGELVLHRIEQD